MSAGDVEAELAAAIDRGFAHAESLDWKSHDPFDLLLSPYARPIASFAVPARVWIQVGRRTGCESAGSSACRDTARRKRWPTSCGPRLSSAGGHRIA